MDKGSRSLWPKLTGKQIRITLLVLLVPFTALFGLALYQTNLHNHPEVILSSRGLFAVALYWLFNIIAIALVAKGLLVLLGGAWRKTFNRSSLAYLGLGAAYGSLWLLGFIFP